MYNKDIAHIVYASDDRFAEILGVSLVSLYENNKDFSDIVVYILDSGISEDNKSKLLSLSEKYKRSGMIFIPAKDISKELSVEVNLDRGSLSQYARLFVSSVLPSELNRVLYLDCDIIINKSISELWNLDLEGNTIGALNDAFSKYYRRNIDLEENDIMFNSGVMLIDLDKWRDNSIEQKLMSFIKKKKGKIQQGDQGALNAVLSRETYCFEPRFNSVTIFYDFSYDEILVYRKPVNLYSREQIRKAIEDPVIIHYTTSFMSERPWIEGSDHKYLDKWIKFKKISPWNEYPLWVIKKSNSLSSVYKKISKKLPRKIMIYISGILQVYGRPFIYSLK